MKWTEKWTDEEEEEEEEEDGRLFIRISLGRSKDNASPWPSCPEEPLPHVNILPSAVIAMLTSIIKYVYYKGVCEHTHMSVLILDYESHSLPQSTI